MTTAPAKAGRREWVGLGVIALPCLLYSMDLTVLHLAVPQMSADLNPSSAELLWIIDIYGFLVAGSLITMGTLGDRIGRRRMLLIGAAAFGVASVAAAFSTTTEMLIGTRALLGLAGATVAPSTLSLIRNMFLDARERTFAVGVWITSYSVGGAIGPLVGGVLIEAFWWGAVFLMAVPVMALLLIVGPLLLPEYRDPDAGRPDVTSALLSLGAVLAVIYGLKQIAQDGFEVVSALTIVTGAVLGHAFVRRQRTLADPLIDLRLFRLPAFSASLATYGVSVFVMFGGFLFLPQYLQLVLGLSPLQAGLWTLPWTAAFIVGSMLTPLTVRRVPAATVMTAGLALGALGFAMLAAVGATTSFLWFAGATFIFSLGLAPVVTLTTDLIIGSAPPERAGAASAISETSAEFGGAIGIAVFGSIGVAVYRGMMAGAIPPGLPPAAAESVLATLGGAAAAAQGLPAEAAATLTAASRAAFVQGLRLCAGVSAVGCACLAVFAWRSLRGMGRGAEGGPASGPQPAASTFLSPAPPDPASGAAGAH